MSSPGCARGGGRVSSLTAAQGASGDLPRAAWGRRTRYDAFLLDLDLEYAIVGFDGIWPDRKARVALSWAKRLFTVCRGIVLVSSAQKSSCDLM